MPMKRRLHGVQQMVLEDQIVEWLVAQAKVTDETVSFSDVMDKHNSKDLLNVSTNILINQLRALEAAGGLVPIVIEQTARGERSF